MKILITGGCGFIGSALVRYLISCTEHEVINVDKLTYAANLKSLEEVAKNSRYRLEVVDICNRHELERVFRTYQPDAVMHLAAESHVDRSITGPADFIQTNIVGTYTLLEVSRAYWRGLEARRKPAFRFHHVSTDEVYGELPHPDEFNADFAGNLTTSNDSTLSSPLFIESTPYAPSSPYSASKAASDHLVRAWHRTYGLPVLLSNCSNNYGPFQFAEKLIPLVILNALKGEPLPVYGKGDQIRDWLYVDDHARALYKVLTEGKMGETYNIGGHNEKRNIDVVKSICALLDELVPIQCSSLSTRRSISSNTQDFASGIPSYESLITFVADRPGHDRRYAIDASKIERELGWQPRESFESGLRKTVEWYVFNVAGINRRYS